MSKRLVPTINVSGDIESGKVYLTPGIQPPADGENPLDQIQLHSEMQSYASGGSIYHMNLNESMDSDIKCNLIKSLFNNFPLRYITLTPTMSQCEECGHKLIGKNNTCSECGSSDVSVWSRVVGYYRPAVRKDISDDLKESKYKFWNSGRLEEFRNRLFMDEECITGLIPNNADILS